MSDDPVQLSLRLSKVLERIGVSESMRTIYRDVSISSEILGTVTDMLIDNNTSMYIFGSSCEGTKTPDMGSDIDVVVCDENLPVIEDIREARPDCTFNLLMVASIQDRPGYVKLQLTRDGTPLTVHNYDIDDTQCYMYDCEGRVCLRHYTVQGEIEGFNERNGPADSISNVPSLISLDQVFALRCRSFPQIATESLNKSVACGWMSEDDIERMKRLGILLVGVGHQASDEQDIEWRISFSLQERELMLALNPTQHKCYVLLKIIKNSITRVSDTRKALTSYHCKTCLFTVIADNNSALWVEGNLIKCTFICLTELMKWISQEHCPTFFIKKSNLFERKEFVAVREHLLHTLREIIHKGHMFVYDIESDFIGKALQEETVNAIDDRRTKLMYDVLMLVCQNTCWCQRRVLEYCHALQSDEHITHHFNWQLSYLATVDTITEHTQEQTQMTVRRLKPIIHKLYAQHLASMAFSTEDSECREQLLTSSSSHLSLGRNCDMMSGRLLEVTILYRAGNLQSCCRLLEQIELSLPQGPVVSVSMCSIHEHIRNDYLMRSITSGYINQQNIMESAVATWMLFLPSQSEIIPKALQYEMYRSVGADPEFTDTYEHGWYDFAVVDSKVYLYFMQYLVYSDLNQSMASRSAIDQIWKVLRQDPNFGHRETAYNLLGWIYIREGEIKKAVECFCQSWKIRPDHNAARWHVPGLLVRLREQLKTIRYIA